MLNGPGIVETEMSLSCVGRWHCGDLDFAVRPKVSSTLLAQAWQRHDDHMYPAGTSGRQASCGWLNSDAVIQRERPACTAQTSNRALGREDTCIPSSRACTLPICHIELSMKKLCQTAVVSPCAAAFMTHCSLSMTSLGWSGQQYIAVVQPRR